jgi:hypothetical protein
MILDGQYDHSQRFSERLYCSCVYQLHDARTAAQNTSYIGYLPPNKDAIPLMDKKVRDLYAEGFSPDAEVMKRLEWASHATKKPKFLAMSGLQSKVNNRESQNGTHAVAWVPLFCIILFTLLFIRCWYSEETIDYQEEIRLCYPAQLTLGSLALRVHNIERMYAFYTPGSQE